MLPAAVQGALGSHLADVRRLHEADLAGGFGRGLAVRAGSQVAQGVHRLAVVPAGITKRVSPPVMRHCFATHLLEDGYDIRTVQELLGHRDERTTMIHLHVMQRGALGVKSPMDRI